MFSVLSQEMINEIDQDGNGCISFNEFVYLMTKNVHEVRGHVHMTSTNFSDFLIPLPSLHFHTTSFTLTASTFEVPPSICRHHMYMPPSAQPTACLPTTTALYLGTTHCFYLIRTETSRKRFERRSECSTGRATVS